MNKIRQTLEVPAVFYGSLVVIAILIVLLVRGFDRGTHVLPQAIMERSDSIRALKAEIAAKDGAIAGLIAEYAQLQLMYDSLEKLSTNTHSIHEKHVRHYRSASADAAWRYLGQRPDSLWRQPAGVQE